MHFPDASTQMDFLLTSDLRHLYSIAGMFFAIRGISDNWALEIQTPRMTLEFIGNE